MVDALRNPEIDFLRNSADGVRGASDWFGAEFVLAQDLFGYSQDGALVRWNGAAWIDAPVKRWDGVAWVDARILYWGGASWLPSL